MGFRELMPQKMTVIFLEERFDYRDMDTFFATFEALLVLQPSRKNKMAESKEFRIIRKKVNEKQQPMNNSNNHKNIIN